MACRHCQRDVRIEGHGYCSACYSRLVRHGRLERVNIVNRGKICSFEGCEKAAFSRGLCQYHYDNQGHDLHHVWIQRKNRADHDPRWQIFDNFLEDVGERPSKKHQLRRIDKSKPFTKENVRWLDPIPYKQGTPEYTRDHQLQRQFGINLEEFNDILKEQGGVCAICKQPETRVDTRHNKLRDICVDHDHTTGKVRGLLCAECNTTLGRVKDSIEILQSAIAYLEKHQP